MEEVVNAEALFGAPLSLLRRAVKYLEEQIEGRPPRARLNVLEARKRLLLQEIERRSRRARP